MYIVFIHVLMVRISVYVGLDFDVAIGCYDALKSGELWSFDTLLLEK